jgi:hypothetical protein
VTYPVSGYQGGGGGGYPGYGQQGMQGWGMPSHMSGSSHQNNSGTPSVPGEDPEPVSVSYHNTVSCFNC